MVAFLDINLVQSVESVQLTDIVPFPGDPDCVH